MNSYEICFLVVIRTIFKNMYAEIDHWRNEDKFKIIVIYFLYESHFCETH